MMAQKADFIHPRKPPRHMDYQPPFPKSLGLLCFWKAYDWCFMPLLFRGLPFVADVFTCNSQRELFWAWSDTEAQTISTTRLNLDLLTLFFPGHPLVADVFADRFAKRALPGVVWYRSSESLKHTPQVLNHSLFIDIEEISICIKYRHMADRATEFSNRIFFPVHDISCLLISSSRLPPPASPLHTSGLSYSASLPISLKRPSKKCSLSSSSSFSPQQQQPLHYPATPTTMPR